jgi:pimeloyl-ACP methyl ester carboxylesterase
MSTNKPVNPSTFVLVHSAFLGGWAWEPVASILEKEGHKVVAPDMPAHGKDKTPPSEVSLDSYVKTVTNILDSQPEPLILVGHSLGGIIISQAAENRPDKVKALVYLCAFLLPSGGSFMKATEGVKGSMVLDNLVMGDDKTSVTIKEEVMREAFAHDVPAEAFARVRPLIVPEPMAPLAWTIQAGGRRNADRGRRRGGDRRFCLRAAPHPFQEVARVDQEGVGGRPAAVPEVLTGNAHRFAHRRGGCHRAHPAPSRALARGGARAFRHRPAGRNDPRSVARRPLPRLRHRTGHGVLRHLKRPAAPKCASRTPCSAAPSPPAARV